MKRRLVLILLVFAVCFIVGILVQALPAWIWHPLGYCSGPPRQVIDCEGYNFWSGISGSNITIPFTCAAFLTAAWYKHNCHVPGCWRLTWHTHPDHGHLVCKRHHPHGDADHPVWAVHA
jgi:hypothetical protein